MNKLKTESPTSIETHLAALYGRINYERHTQVTPRHFKLQNMKTILERLGNPHLNYSVVHVAGTKGKGSVSTMVGQILSTAGKRTGVYTSPHLETINQRMAIDGNLISDDQLVATLTKLQPIIEQMDQEAAKEGLRHLTFFEITTAAALLFFSDQKCDSVVLEVGLGGRLDSTNVCQPTVTAITNISLDHTRQLGFTLDKIAFEKAGIIKQGIPVISGATAPEAHEVITKIASENDAPLIFLNRDVHLKVNSDLSFSCAGEVANSKFEIGDLTLALIGEHQRINAALAVAIVKAINATNGWEVSENDIREGLKVASIAGRMELASTSPTVIIDMAHNVASMNALVATLKNDLPQWETSSKRILVLAISRDKDIPAILKLLVGNFDKVIFTKYKDNPRGKSEKELLKLAKSIQAKPDTSNPSANAPKAVLLTAPTPQAAWKLVQSELTDDQLVCLTGSAFLVAELRKTLLTDLSNPS
ncbi:MAG: folylpolyglutamate synthase/dihydrofolate synthase family protein [Mariniblastus sp.]